MKGFTLIEVIVGIVLFAIVGTMFVSLFTDSISDSAKSINNLRNQWGSASEPDGLVGVLEEITYHFNEQRATYDTNIATAGTYPGTTHSSVTINGHEYRKVVVKKGNQQIVAIFPP